MNWIRTLNDMRDAGWLVASHNDYRLNGKLMTFWLFTHPAGIYVKGEAETDEQAILMCAQEARKSYPFSKD